VEVSSCCSVSRTRTELEALHHPREHGRGMSQCRISRGGDVEVLAGAPALDGERIRLAKLD